MYASYPNTMSSHKSHEALEELKKIYECLQKEFHRNRSNNQTQQTIYRQIVKVFHVFSKDLESIASRINDQVLRSNEQLLVHQFENNTYQYLSNSLLRLGECSRKVTIRCQNQILEPFKLFTENYVNLGEQQIKKLNVRINNIRLHGEQLQRQKLQYRQANEKLRKQKDQQVKMMIKMETISSNKIVHDQKVQQSQRQLTRFNRNLQKSIESISTSEKFYIGAVQKANFQWAQTKQDLEKIHVSLSYNQESKNAFCRKNAIGCIKTLEEFRNAIDAHIQIKLEQDRKNLSTSKEQIMMNQRPITLKIKSITEWPTQQTFESYEDQQRRLKKQASLIEQTHLVDLFNQVPAAHKQVIQSLVTRWFLSANGGRKKSACLATEQVSNLNLVKKVSNTNKDSTTTTMATLSVPSASASTSISTSISTSTNSQLPTTTIQILPPQIKKKIVQKRAYSFYFIEILHLSVIEMSSFYCKLNEQEFVFVCNVLTQIVKGIDLVDNKSRDSATNTEFLYKIIVASQRIMKSLSNHHRKSSSINNDESFTLQEQKNKNEEQNDDKQKDSLNSENKKEQITKSVSIKQNVKDTPSASSQFHYSSSSSSSSTSIQLVSHYIGKKAKDKLNSANLLKRLFDYILKRRQSKKKLEKSEKGVMGTLTKGLMNFNVFSSKREQSNTNQQEQFSCLIELANIISMIQIPTQTSIPFIKNTLNKLGNNNQASFEYLKNRILAKNDILQRKKIFYKAQVKQKLEKQILQLKKDKLVGSFCIRLAAKKGYLGIEQVRLRSLCKDLRNVHQHILYNLDIKVNLKWPRMIPFNSSLNVQSSNQLINKQTNISRKPATDQQIEQIITLDVNRSLHIHLQTLKPQILTRLLKTYAMSHRQVAYCQGMNYIAGYLFIKCNQFQSSYRLFEYLMQSNFKQLFVNQFEVLKLKMYQFERLLAIYHPEISEHFKRQAILTQCYMISWIITVFSSCYQHTKQSFLIDFVWERFILWGWKEFFKFVLWIFGIFKQQLVEMTYDKALHFFGDLLKGPLILSSKEQYLKNQFNEKYGDVRQGIQLYHYVTNEFLENLKKEYYLM